MSRSDRTRTRDLGHPMSFHCNGGGRETVSKAFKHELRCLSATWGAKRNAALPRGLGGSADQNCTLETQLRLAVGLSSQ